MKNLIRITISFIFVVTIFNSGQSQSKLVTQEILNTGIENLMNSANISGLSACIVKNNSIVYQNSFGLANRELIVPVSDCTVFLLYSLTKTFTGVALMQLLQADSFQLDDCINNYMPFEIRHPDYSATDITFRMLMCHISGINDNWDVINQLYVLNSDSTMSIEAFIQAYLLPGGLYYNANTSFTNCEPGTNFNYSNVGGTLGGYLVEKISGMPYEQYVYEHILLPLQMNNSSYSMADFNDTLLAQEYTFSGTTYQPTGMLNHPMKPAGFLRSTISDLSHYLQMLLQDGRFNQLQIIDSSLLQQMLCEQYPVIAPNSGLFFGFDNINLLWGHSGAHNGVKTLMFFDKAEEWGVAILSNGGGEPWQIAYMLYQYARDYKTISLHQVDVVDADSDYVFEANELLNLSMVMRNNSLIALGAGEAYLSCHHPLISVVDGQAQFAGISSGDTVAVSQVFQIHANDFDTAFEAEFVIAFYNGEIFIDSATIKLYFGNADVLLVDDEEHLYKNRANAFQYYQNSIINAGRTTRAMNTDLFKFPLIPFFNNFESVVWYTGLDNSNSYSILPENEREMLATYLQNQGKLFISGQNISEAIGQTEFFENMLKAVEVTGTYSGNYNVSGIAANMISNGLNFSLTGGDGSNTTYSPSVLMPNDGSEKLFNYSNSTSCAGIMFSGDYKLVYLPFCFASIAGQWERDELMERILNFLEAPVSVNSINNINDINIFPNPAINNTVIIDGKNNRPCTIEIYNLSGKLIRKYHSVRLPKTLNIKDLDAGCYMLRISTAASSCMQKLIVQ